MTGIHSPKPQTSPRSNVTQPTALPHGSQGNGGVSPTAASVPIPVYRELANELQTAQAKLSFFQLQNEQLMRQNQQLIQSFENINQEMQRMQMLLSQSHQGNPAHLSEVIAALKSIPGNSSIGNDRDVPLPPRNGKGKLGAPHADQPEGEAFVTAQMVQDAVLRAQQIASQQVKSQQTNNPVQTRPSDLHGAEDRGAGFSVDPSSPIQPMVMLKDNTVPKPKPKATAKPTAAKSPKPAEKAAPRTETKPVESNDEQSVGGWWLALTVLLIVLTSFGAGYFLMRPFVNSTVNHGTPSQNR